MCMIMTLIEGIDDDFRTMIPGNPLLVTAVMIAGKAVNRLTSEACLKGKDLKEMLIATNVYGVEEMDIKNDNHYKVTSFDW